MRVECPECLFVTAVSDDLIVTRKRALELTCSKCKSDIQIQMSLAVVTEQDQPFDAALDDHLTRLTSSNSETEEDPEVLSLKSKILRSLVELPPMPNIILKAREIIEDPRTSLKDLSAVIEHDQAIVARVLALANSAYYGLSGLVSSIQHASILLGQKTLSELITIAASSRLLSKKLKGYQLEPGDLWQHSLAVALGSRIIAGKKNPKLVEDAFIAGLLHDAGKIILDPYIVERKKEFKTLQKKGEHVFVKAEKEILGFDHAEVMSRASRFWRYPETQSTAIRYHHHPLRAGNNELALIVHLADYAAKKAGFNSDNKAPSPEIDPQTLDRLGFQEDDLNAIVAEVADDVVKLVSEFQ
jgi:HD-like signal output (HDOD) protein